MFSSLFKTTSSRNLLGILLFCLLGVGQVFAEGEKCAANTTWGGFKTVIATKGTDGYYEIDTPEKLAWFSCEITKTNTASQKTNAKLMQSIDLQGKLFIPISAGKGTPSFGGIFDGQGFTIKNLFIDASEIVKSTNGGDAKYAQNIGLFAALKGGTIKNVTLTNVEIYAASSAGDAGTNGADNPISVGAVAGYLESGTITGCAVSGKIETSGNVNRVGGVAGNVWAATISDCISEADVIATGNNTHVGGILGAVRKDGDVTINSCVYAGETLFSDNGSVGAVVGNYEKNKNITTNDLYYSADYPAVGTGLGSRPFNSTQVDDLNTEDVICELNGGTWNTSEGTCSNAPSNVVWSEGQSELSINGSDGYKVTFDANGGVFPEGAMTSKFFAKGTAITANEIENPTYSGKKFVGWSLTQGGAVQDLGVADMAKSVYAVWKPIRTITFNAAPGAFDGGSSVASKLVAEGDVVTVEGLPALPVKFCSQETAGNCDKYAYFHGWSTVSHAPYGENDTIPEENIVDLPTFEFESDTTLYAVWVESETYTVTFNANGHGQTKVAFVKVGKGETTVQPPDPNADDGYIFTGRWCKETSCDDSTKFDFDSTEIDTSIVLYADWDVPDYNITYIVDGEPNTATGNPAKYDVEDSTITLAKPDSAGYVFDGWYDEDGNKATTILSGSTGDKIFHGSWIPVTYTITYLADNTLSLTTTSDVKQHGVAKQLKGPSYAHGGCTQDGWSKVSYGKDGYNLDYPVNGSYEEDKDVILFPYWNCNTYKITYEIYGMSVKNRNDSTYTGPAKMTLENAFDPAKKYFFMDNWYKEPTFKTVIRDIQNIDADLTVYAKWYNKITYKPGSKVSGAKNLEEKKYFDTTYTLKSSIDKYVRANYTLDGWSTTDGGDKVYELGGKYNTNENLTLYPHWTPEAFPIVYHNIEGATFETPNPETYTVEDEDIDLNNPSKPGYNFLGWSLEENSTEYVDGIAAGSTGEANFYANWEKVYPFLVNDYGAIKVYENEKGQLTAEIDGMSKGDVDVITPEDSVFVNYINFNREFPVNAADSDKMYSTIVLPFSIDKSKVPSAEFYELKAVDVPNKTVEFWSTKGTLQANTPYIIRTESATLSFNLDEGETVALNTSELNNSRSDDGLWEFRGTYSYRKWQEGDADLGRAYGFRGNARDSYSIGSFARIGAGAAIRPFRAYLLKVANQQARRYTLAKSSAALNMASIVEETVPGTLDVVIVDRETEQTTVIGKLNTATGEIKIIDNWFDMKGRKLNGKPTTKGIYYYNGKRVMVK